MPRTIVRRLQKIFFVKNFRRFVSRHYFFLRLYRKNRASNPLTLSLDCITIRQVRFSLMKKAFGFGIDEYISWSLPGCCCLDSQRRKYHNPCTLLGATFYGGPHLRAAKILSQHIEKKTLKPQTSSPKYCPYNKLSGRKF